MTCLRRVEPAKTAAIMLLELTEVMLSEVIADSSHGVAMRSSANELACKASRCVVSESELCTK